MDIQLSDTRKMLYLASLRIQINTGGKEARLANNIGLGNVTKSQRFACERLYSKIANAKLNVNVTKANLKEILLGMQSLGYLFSFDEDICRIIYGINYNQFSIYLDEVNAAIRGKLALQDFHMSTPDPQMM